MCHACLAGQGVLDWGDLTDSAPWRSTMFQERPWKAEAPNCLDETPFSSTAPERMFRSDSLHLIKLGVARHFLASSIVLLGELNVWPGSSASVDKILDLSHRDFVWACGNELHQTPHLKNFTRDLFHWKKRSNFPWGGILFVFKGVYMSIHA